MAVTTYYWDFDTDNVFLEEDENGDTIAEYTHEPGLYGELLAQERDGQVRYYNYDGQGSTRELTDENGDVTDTYTYTAFGEEIAHSGTTDNPFRYKGAWGYYTNSDTNDIYVRVRTYEPMIGRWHAADPFLFTDGANVYRFVRNSPHNGIDPSGALTVEVGTGVQLKGSCGREFYMSWNFKLDTMFGTKNGAPCKGWIVQKVTVTCTVGKCWKNPNQVVVIVLGVGTFESACCGCERAEPETFDYYEAWPVEQGKPYSSVRKVGNFTDRARFTARDDACGMYTQTGEIKFFCEEGPGGIGDLTKNQMWKGPLAPNIPIWYPDQNHPCRTTPGKLLSTGDQPNWWGNLPTDGPNTRKFELDWFCCKCGDPKDYARADADPRP